MIEVLSQQLRNLYRAETHKYCEQVSRVRQKMRRARQTPYRAKDEFSNEAVVPSTVIAGAKLEALSN